jgi:hypothetical protein
MFMDDVFAGIHVCACVREEDAMRWFGCLVLWRCPDACEDESDRLSLGWGAKAGSIEVLGPDVVRFAVGLLDSVRGLGVV